MVALNAIEQKTYRDLLSAIAKRPQGSKVQVRDLFGIDLGQPTNHPDGTSHRKRARLTNHQR